MFAPNDLALAYDPAASWRGELRALEARRAGQAAARVVARSGRPAGVGAPVPPSPSLGRTSRPSTGLDEALRCSQ